MSRKSGYLLQITEGLHKGEYAIAYHKEQNENFRSKEKLFVHFFFDMLCQKPTGKACLISLNKVKGIGMVD